MDIAFDIETMPNMAMMERMPEPEVKTGNLKDPEKIREKYAEARTEQVKRMALSPLYGRICAAVVIYDGNDNHELKLCITEDSDDAETALLTDLFREFSGNRIVTYNGSGFDLPFVYRRAVMLGIDTREYGLPTLAEMTARYNNKHHVDLMLAWCGFGNYEKLDHIAHALLDDAKIDIDFQDFPELIKTNTGREQLVEYCRQDVALTMKLWNRISGILI